MGKAWPEQVGKEDFLGGREGRGGRKSERSSQSNVTGEDTKNRRVEYKL